MKIEKKHYLWFTVIAFSVCCLSVKAQGKFKFGDVSREELSMSVYPNDTTAAAAVLYEDCDVWYDVDQDMVIKTRHIVRMKILKPAGLGRADISIPFYVGSSRAKSESVYGISGYTYNEVNGKTERIKLSKDNIFEEKTSENMQRVKIAFPNVKVGSVFELKYEKTSPYYTYLEDFVFQRSIPVKYCRFKAVIPEYFNFHKRTLGYEKINLSENKTNLTFLFGGSDRLSCSGQEMIFETTDLPALKDDDYVWNKQDYTAKVTFDLMSVTIPGKMHKNFSVTWQDIDKQLMDSDNFGRQLRFSDLMKTDLPTVLNDSMSSRSKAEAILKLVKEKIQWNDENALYIDNVKKAIKEGKGTSAEMNAALICVLRDAGFDAYPVVMSLRSHGRIFSVFPTQKSLNYFITGVNIDGKPAYMDASEKHGSIDMISADCMVQEARCLYKDKPAQWVDLHRIGRNGFVIDIAAGFNDDGKFSGSVREIMTGVPCMMYSRKIDKQKSADEYKAELEAESKMTITDLEQGKPEKTSVTEKYSFTDDDITTGDDHIYINSLIFPYIKENPFKAETRKLPVEHPYPYELVMSVAIAIPKGYEVEEIPAAERITFGDNKQINYSYLTQKDNEVVRIIQRISLRQTLYPTTEYQHIRDFWTHVADKNNAQLVFKRVVE